MTTETQSQTSSADGLARVEMPNGMFAYAVDRAESVAKLPYYYLCALSDQTGFVYPQRTTALWMGGPFTVLGLCKGGRT